MAPLKMPNAGVLISGETQQDIGAISARATSSSYRSSSCPLQALWKHHHHQYYFTSREYCNAFYIIMAPTATSTPATESEKSISVSSAGSRTIIALIPLIKASQPAHLPRAPPHLFSPHTLNSPNPTFCIPHFRFHLPDRLLASYPTLSRRLRLHPIRALLRSSPRTEG